MGGPEIGIVLVIAIVVIFGVNKLPQIARNMGKAQGEFKKGLKEGATDEERAAAAAAAAASAAPPAAPAEQPPAEQPQANNEQPS